MKFGETDFEWEMGDPLRTGGRGPFWLLFHEHSPNSWRHPSDIRIFWLD